MNLFVTNENPKLAAMDLDDRRLTKGVIETAMILCNALFIRGLWMPSMYRPGHEHHPICKWSAASTNNFRWTYHYGVALANEYEFRYGRSHGSLKIMTECWEQFNKRLKVFPSDAITPFVNLTPFKQELDTVYAYRRYLIEEKWGPMTTWSKRDRPGWYKLERSEVTLPLKEHNRKVLM